MNEIAKTLLYFGRLRDYVDFKAIQIVLVKNGLERHFELAFSYFKV